MQRYQNNLSKTYLNFSRIKSYLCLSKDYRMITELLQNYYRIITELSQNYYRIITELLQNYYRMITEWLQNDYRIITELLQNDFIMITEWLELKVPNWRMIMVLTFDKKQEGLIRSHHEIMFCNLWFVSTFSRLWQEVLVSGIKIYSKIQTYVFFF